MDPVTLILTALAAGVTRIGADAGADAYHRLVDCLRRRFHRDDRATGALQSHIDNLKAEKDSPGAGDPKLLEESERTLREYLRPLDLGEDEGIMVPAHTLVRLMKAAETRVPTFEARAGNVTFGSGSSTMVIGDVASARITQQG